SKELQETNVVALFNGTLPTALPASTGLIAYWPFNDPTTGGSGGPPVTIAKTVVGGVTTVTLTYTGTLESTTTLGSGWAPVVGATSPYPLTTPSGAAIYYRSKQ